MIKKLLFTCMFVLLTIGMTWAQEKQVTGRVTEAETGEGVPGATVQIKGTTEGVGTDFDGNFSINVPSSKTVLIFTSIGYEDKEVVVGNQTTIKISLDADTKELDAVVVVAYGEQKAKSLTGAVTSVDASIIDKQTATSALSSLQGSAAGVNVLTSGGQPGSNPTIRIRGVGSINADANPLILVDGVVFYGNINSISSDQIESVNVLKDASAVALYGSRGANGVILITTKKGKFNSKSTINVSISSGIASTAVKPHEVVGAESYMKLSWESLRNKYEYKDGLGASEANQQASDNLISHVGYNPYGTEDKPVGPDGKIVSGANLLWDTDWFDEVLRDQSSYEEYKISFAGGSDKLRYFLSTNYLDQEGTVIESDFKRISTRLNIESKMNDWLDIGLNSSFSTSTQNYPNQSGTSYTSTIQWAFRVPSIYPVYARDEQGQLKKDIDGNRVFDLGNAQGVVNAVRPALGGDNIVSATTLNDIEYKRYSTVLNGFAKAQLLPNLSLTSRFGFEMYLYDEFSYDHYKYSAAESIGGRVTKERTLTQSYTWTNTLNYSNTFGEHTIDASLLSEYVDYELSNLSAQGTGFLPNVKVLSGSAKPESVGGFLTPERLVSFLGNVRYSFMDRYFIDGSFRRDGSSRFGSEQRWGNFYAVGGSWVLSDENFISDIAFISNLKLRSSYGEIGNNRGIGYFPYLSTFDTGWSNGDYSGVLQGGIVDPLISWEAKKKFNVGLDFGLFDNRLTGSFEYYDDETDQMLFDKPLAGSTGNTILTTNIGSMRDSGLELTLKGVVLEEADYSWRLGFNIAMNKNEITSLPQEEIIVGSKKRKVGESAFEFFVREYAGIDSEDGETMWYMDEEDEEGNVERITTKVYGDATRYYVGKSSLPDFTGGLSSNFQYKGIELDVLFNFSLGGHVLDYSYAGMTGSLDGAGDQAHIDIEKANRWKKPGDIADFPRLIASKNDYSGRSTRYLFENDFVRMKAISLSYSLPKSFLEKIKLNKVKVYVQGDNLFTWSTVDGIDPEQNISGTTDSRSYIMKIVSAGVKIQL